ncbi:unnamed protein product [Fusarium fujikuroi]|uniref:Uncharacterized protein n=1 Tax=Fusarium fujikuroi TaxID=5127 RepID=A0A9Q9RH67_FUSFU|nr:unnamed protein product [Fusarium fujikuroi]VZH90890.1 unnamed protein product [Fusarium fujikuroi]
MSLKFHDRESSSTPVTVQLTGKPMFQTRMSLQARALKKSNFQRIQIEEFEVLIVDMINGDTDTNVSTSCPLPRTVTSGRSIGCILGGLSQGPQVQARPVALRKGISLPLDLIASDREPGCGLESNLPIYRSHSLKHNKAATLVHSLTSDKTLKSLGFSAVLATVYNIFSTVLEDLSLV